MHMAQGTSPTNNKQQKTKLCHVPFPTLGHLDQSSNL